MPVGTVFRESAGDRPGYNRTVASERYSDLSSINIANASRLQVLCTYDTKQKASFEQGPIVVGEALIGTTEHDVFSLDSATCRENWRTHERYQRASLLAVNRGAAYLDGRVFRGTDDGRVLAYDFKTGARLWATTIGNARLGKSTPAAPIVRNGMVFIGNAGGDNKGVKGRMYALDAKTGAILWEFFLVPKSPETPVPAGSGWPSPAQAGWVYAVDADSGAWIGRLKLNLHLSGGMTPTAGGVAFFGDMAGNFYVLETATGEKLWGHMIGGAIGGRAVTYVANGAQRVAVETGFSSTLWPARVTTTGKVVVLGIPAATSPRSVQ